MIRHIAMFTFKPDAPPGTASAFCEALGRLPAAIPEIARYSFGPDLGLRDGTYDFAVVADFESADDFRTYVAHPDHQAFIQDLLTPAIDARVSLQFEL